MQNTIETVINILLSRSTQGQRFASMAQWFTSFNQQTGYFESPLHRAMLGGRFSANVSFAFAAAYQSAIESLFQPEACVLSAFCVSEKQGSHPRAIETALYQDPRGIRLSGSKGFVSGATDAECLYVACQDKRSGSGLDAEGRPLIKVVKVEVSQQGLEIQKLPPLGFVPDIAHGKVKFSDVLIKDEDILPGDGYLNYVKAFRSVEDVHVLAAITAYRLGEAIQGHWPEQLITAHLPVILGLHTLVEMELSKPAAHIGLAAVRSQFDELLRLTDKHFSLSNPQAFSDWNRDKVLLNVAQQAHQRRTDSAWQKMFSR